jgi:hypothetical protein
VQHSSVVSPSASGSVRRGLLHAFLLPCCFSCLYFSACHFVRLHVAYCSPHSLSKGVFASYPLGQTPQSPLASLPFCILFDRTDLFESRFLTSSRPSPPSETARPPASMSLDDFHVLRSRNIVMEPRPPRRPLFRSSIISVRPILAPLSSVCFVPCYSRTSCSLRANSPVAEA